MAAVNVHFCCMLMKIATIVIAKGLATVNHLIIVNMFITYFLE